MTAPLELLTCYPTVDNMVKIGGVSVIPVILVLLVLFIFLYSVSRNMSDFALSLVAT